MVIKFLVFSFKLLVARLSEVHGLSLKTKKAPARTERVLSGGKFKTVPGFTLIELLIYTGILILLVAVVGSTLLSLARTYRSIAAEQSIESAAIATLERISREARNATSVDVGGSVLGSSPGVLSLNTKDPSGAAEVVQFFLSEQVLHVREAGVDQGPLTPATARVTNLVFRTIATGESTAVKIDMTIESGTSTAYHVRSFYDTSILRPTYAQ